MKIYQVLEGLRTTRRYDYMGICTNAWSVAIKHGIRGIDLRLQTAMEQWPEHSGDEAFPIADPTKQYSPSKAYSHYVTWGKSAYAKKRFELLEWLIAHFKEQDI